MSEVKYTLKVGDLLEHAGRFGLITKVRHKSFQYFICSNPEDNGAFFDHVRSVGTTAGKVKGEKLRAALDKFKAVVSKFGAIVPEAERDAALALQELLRGGR